jgi:DNA-binding response OmpR family regulator
MVAVLLVDDSAVVRAAGEQRLRALGFDVTVVGSSREARAVDAARFGAALLDLDLGDGSGVDVARALRAASPTLPIAFLTASEAGASLADAAHFGPVFSKASGVEGAMEWVKGAARG